MSEKPHTQASRNVICDRDSVFLSRQCNTLCISGSVDDVMFSHDEPSGIRDRANADKRSVWFSLTGTGAKSAILLCSNAALLAVDEM